MSGLAQNNNSLKKVLRTAFVGVKPADQVMLKGYLRILLRLETDLEWVSASHSQVDLFIINNEFRHAASVTKLLANQQHNPVLYASRASSGEGKIEADKIILPLKKLDALQHWLSSSVAVFGGSVPAIGVANDPLEHQEQNNITGKTELVLSVDSMVNDTDTATTSTYQTEATASNTNVDTKIVSAHQANIVASKTNINNKIASNNKANSARIDEDYFSSVLSANNSFLSNPSHKNNATSTSRSIKPMSDYKNIISLIKRLQQRPDGLQQIISQNRTVAVIEASCARVWVTDDTASSGIRLDWQLQPYAGEGLVAAEAQDLIQWLWQKSWENTEAFLPLVGDDIAYRLRYWIKPVSETDVTAGNTYQVSAKDRRELLQVMTALESAPCGVNQLASIASISVKTAKKIIASLLFSGSLQADNYIQLDTYVNHTPKNRAFNNPLSSDRVSSNEAAQAQASQPNVDRALNLPPQSPSITLSTDTSHDKQTTLDALLARRAQGESALPTTSNIIIHPDVRDIPNNKSVQSEPMTTNNESESSPTHQAKSSFLSRLRQKLGL